MKPTFIKAYNEGLDDSHIEKLCEFLSIRNLIDNLMLRKNKIGDESAKAIAKYILDTNNPDEINSSNGVMQLFGWESTAGHKWAWCPETLGQQLYRAGFTLVEQGDGYFHNNPVRDFLIVGTK